MQIKKNPTLVFIGMGILLLIGVVFLWPASSAEAQCGSQASSCKNCHETQAKDPVNNDGTGWHQGHAFGDFCYLCHAGNNQSMDEEQAHAGMVDPLSDVQAACGSCHPNDLMERANVYASALGVSIGTGGGSTGGTTGAPPSGGSSPGSGENPQEPPAEPSSAEIVVNPSDVVDYSQRYDETVLGQRTINWGNVILWVIILGVAVGGGFFVYWNERRLRGQPMIPAKSRQAEAKSREAPSVEGYSSEITSLLPMIARLNPQGLHALKKILAEPDQANEILHSLSHLDPELVRKLRALDRDTRALLMAMAGD
jgi:hypothetical protein